MSLHEQAPSSSQANDFELDPRLETYIDQGIYNPVMAEMAMTGARPRTFSEHGPSRSTRATYSRRGGRSYPEASDSELDPYWNASAAGFAGSPPEKGNGYHGAQVAAQIIADEALRREADGDVSRLLALQRSRYERRQAARQARGIDNV